MNYSLGKILNISEFRIIREATLNSKKEPKIIHIYNKKELNSNLELSKKFNLFSQITKDIKCQFILAFLEVVEDENNYYFIYENFVTKTLLDISIQRRFSSCEIINIMNQILFALKALHQSNVVFEEINLRKIYCDDSENNINIRIMDLFGISLANNLPNKNQAGSNLYFSYFTAPEILTLKLRDRSSDIWSCGIIFYVLYTQQNPYQYNSRKDLEKSIKNGEINFEIYKEDLSSQKFVKEMLKLDYKERGNAESLLKNVYLLIETPLNQIPNKLPKQSPRDNFSESVKEYFIFRRMMIRQSQGMFQGLIPYFKISEPNLVEKVQIFNMSKPFCIFKLSDFV